MTIGSVPNRHNTSPVTGRPRLPTWGPKPADPGRPIPDLRWRTARRIDPDIMSPLEFAILGLYFLTLVVLAVFGLHRYIMVFLYSRHGARRARPAPLPARLPRVTVQLPLYNEMYVVDRLVDSVCRIRYPKELLEIQVLDDSVDETQQIARAAVERHREDGFDIHYVHRGDRHGFNPRPPA